MSDGLVITIAIPTAVALAAISAYALHLRRRLERLQRRLNSRRE